MTTMTPIAQDNAKIARAHKAARRATPEPSRSDRPLDPAVAPWLNPALRRVKK